MRWGDEMQKGESEAISTTNLGHSEQADTAQYRAWTKQVRAKINYIGVHKKEVLLMAAAIDTLAEQLDKTRADFTAYQHKCDQQGGHFFEEEDDDG